ncbi:MAG: hypothetical protein ABI085_16840 [Gemmatimonadaceae bacterium]
MNPFPLALSAAGAAGIPSFGLPRTVRFGRRVISPNGSGFPVCIRGVRE